MCVFSSCLPLAVSLRPPKNAEPFGINDPTRFARLVFFLFLCLARVARRGARCWVETNKTSISTIKSLALYCPPVWGPVTFRMRSRRKIIVVSLRMRNETLICTTFTYRSAAIKYKIIYSVRCRFVNISCQHRMGIQRVKNDDQTHLSTERNCFRFPFPHVDGAHPISHPGIVHGDEEPVLGGWVLSARTYMMIHESHNWLLPSRIRVFFIGFNIQTTNSGSRIL